jgi:hypothetical protein
MPIAAILALGTSQERYQGDGHHAAIRRKTAWP